MIFKNLLNLKDKYPTAILSIAPLLFFLLAILFYNGFGSFYEVSVDPEYFFLFNGIVVAKGSLAINFIDHPATPLIYVVAFASRIVHLFTSDTNLVNDFLNDPEKYLLAANTLHNFLIALALFIGSIKIYKYSSSFAIAFLFQMGLFFSPSILVASARLLPESTILIAAFFLIALSLKYVLIEKEQLDLKKLRWQFAIVIALGIASKLSFFPFALFPLILIESTWKYKFQTVGFIALFLLLFAYPLFTNPDVSFRWVSDLLLHSGKHGTGEANFIDLAAVSKHASLLWDTNSLFFISLVIAFISASFLLFQKSKSALQIRISRLLLAYLICMIFLCILVLKHFALHYMIPFYFFSTLPFCLILLLFKNSALLSNRTIRKKQFLAAISFIAILLLAPSILEASKGNEARKFFNKKIERKNATIRSLIQEEEHILIADPVYFGSPFLECGEIQGFMKSYRRKTKFKDELRAKYPNFFLYVTWMDKFNHWDKFMGFEEILNEPKAIYVYIGPKQKGIDVIEKRLLAYNSNYIKQTLYSDKKNKEFLYRYSMP